MGFLGIIQIELYVFDRLNSCFLQCWFLEMLLMTCWLYNGRYRTFGGSWSEEIKQTVSPTVQNSLYSYVSTGSKYKQIHFKAFIHNYKYKYQFLILNWYFFPWAYQSQVACTIGNSLTILTKTILNLIVLKNNQVMYIPWRHNDTVHAALELYEEYYDLYLTCT